MQHGDSTAPERLRLLEEHRSRIRSEIDELRNALELVDRKIAGYEALARGQVDDPPTGRPAARRVRVRS